MLCHGGAGGRVSGYVTRDGGHGPFYLLVAGACNHRNRLASPSSLTSSNCRFGRNWSRRPPTSPDVWDIGISWECGNRTGFFSRPRFDPFLTIWQDRHDGTALIRAVGRGQALCLLPPPCHPPTTR